MSKIIKFFAFDKFVRLLGLVYKNGGIFKSLYKIFLNDDLRGGVLVGVDRNGNKYYEEKRYFMPRNRYVEYNRLQGFCYDASQVDPEWFGWLHHRTDLLPHLEGRPKYKWMLPPVENESGTKKQFYPYSTVKQKIFPWIPGKK